jgi:hypothetical protein
MACRAVTNRFKARCPNGDRNVVPMRHGRSRPRQVARHGGGDLPAGEQPRGDAPIGVRLQRQPSPSRNSNPSQSPVSRSTARMDRRHPGSAPIKTRSSPRQIANERWRPAPSAGTTATRRRGLSTSVTAQLRPASNSTAAVSPARRATLVRSLKLRPPSVGEPRREYAPRRCVRPPPIRNSFAGSARSRRWCRNAAQDAGRYRP